MAIDKEKLISLLVEKTGLEREEIEDQLSELVQRIQKAAEEGKTFEIEGFGTFSVEDEDLQFTPSDKLETEINNKYAGMKPIELIGAFKEPDVEDISDPSGDAEHRKDVWAFDEEAAEKEVESEEQEKEDEIDSVSSEDLSKFFEFEDVETKTGEDDIVKKLTDSDDDSEKSVEPQSKSGSQKTAKTEKESDPIGRVLVAAVVVIVLGVGGWLVYDMGLIGSSDSNNNRTYADQSIEDTRVPAQQTGDTQEDESPATSDADNSSEDQELVAGNDTEDETSEPEQDMQVTTQGDTPSPSEDESEQQENSYGLTGEFNQSLSNGYMIVVHSLRVKQDAEENRQGLQEEGYRTTINAAMVDGTQYYRVGIGQFPTVEAAKEAINRLPEPYKSNNFIKRIR